MSATSAARDYARDIVGAIVKMIQASDNPLTVSALERVYAPLRPTIYRPSRPSVSREQEEHEDTKNMKGTALLAG